MSELEISKRLNITAKNITKFELCILVNYLIESNNSNNSFTQCCLRKRDAGNDY